MALSHLLIIECAIAAAVVPAKADIYVSICGNDADVGSETKPPRTLKASQKAV
jgi:hypothetical protein